MKFSERLGKRSAKTNIQVDSMDVELRNGLWNIITMYIVRPMEKDQWLSYSQYSSLIESIWFFFFKEPTDEIPLSTERVSNALRERFFNWDYLDVYDFIDFLATASGPFKNDELIDGVNFILKRELSGYRFVQRQLAPITNEEEIREIDEALSATARKKLKGVNIHLAEGLKKISDKKAPDYRNSIKESISAVEALCQIITGDKTAELGKALKTLKEKIAIHGALEQGFIKLYGYTSDSDGIRHAMLEESFLDQEDALFMLVSCSAFINYLLIKCRKAGLNIDKD